MCYIKMMQTRFKNNTAFVFQISIAIASLAFFAVVLWNVLG